MFYYHNHWHWGSYLEDSVLIECPNLLSLFWIFTFPDWTLNIEKNKFFKIAAIPKTIFEIFHTIPGKIIKISFFTFFLFLMLEIIRFAWSMAWEELSNRRHAELSLGESCAGKIKLFALWEVLGTLLLLSLEWFYPPGKRFMK